MNRATLKRYRRLRTNSGHILWRNPVLAQGLALPFAIAASTSLQNGVVLSAAMLGAVVIPALIYARAGGLIEDWLRPVVYSLMNALFILGIMQLLSNRADVIGSLGIYLPMVALNTLTIRLVSSEVSPVGDVLRRSLLSWLGFSAVVCLVSAVRELLGAGTLWGLPVEMPLPHMPPLLYPFGGFILVGFLAAGVKGLDRLSLRLLSRLERRGEGESHV